MKQLFLLLIIGSVYHLAYSQTMTKAMSVKEFVEVIGDHPDILASSEKSGAFDHEIELARLSPDPSLTFGNVSGDISGINMPHQFFLGIDYTIETGSKRRRRIAQAKAGKDLSLAQHHVFISEFMRDALLTYQKCWILEQRARELSAYDSLLLSTKLSDSLGLQIMLLENAVLRSEIENELENALEELRELVSHRFPESVIIPTGPAWEEAEVIPPLVAEKHPDLRLARAARRLSEQDALLEKANRIGDISFTIGNNFITEATNPEAPSPRYNAVTATVSVPLRFSSLRHVGRRRSIESASVEDEDNNVLADITARFESAQRETRRLVGQLQQIHSMIALEVQFIKACKESNSLQHALQKLHSLQELRWKKMEQLSVIRSFFHDVNDIHEKKHLAVSPVK